MDFVWEILSSIPEEITGFLIFIVFFIFAMIVKASKNTPKATGKRPAVSVSVKSSKSTAGAQSTYRSNAQKATGLQTPKDVAFSQKSYSGEKLVTGKSRMRDVGPQPKAHLTKDPEAHAREAQSLREALKSFENRENDWLAQELREEARAARNLYGNERQ